MSEVIKIKKEARPKKLTNRHESHLNKETERQKEIECSITILWYKMTLKLKGVKVKDAPKINKRCFTFRLTNISPYSHFASITFRLTDILPH